MPIILKTERRHLRTRLLFALFYLLLAVGGCTMVYPFLLMVSGSLKSRIDANDFDLMPAYLANTDQLYRKHVESKYNENLQDYLTASRCEVRNFRAVTAPPPCDPQLLADWEAFVSSVQMPPSWFMLGLGPTQDGRIIQENERAFRDHIKTICGDDLGVFTERYKEPIENWFFLKFSPERLADRKYQLSGTPLIDAFYRFKGTRPLQDRIYVSCDGEFARYVRLASGGQRTVRVLESTPETGDWEDFVRGVLHPQFVRVGEAARPAWTQFLSKKYYDDVANLNKLYGLNHRAFADVLFPADRMHASACLTDFMLFVTDPTQAPLAQLSLDTPDIRWRSFLGTRYPTPAAAGNAHGREYASFADIPMPQSEHDYQYCKDHRALLIRRYLSRNYLMVIEYILLYGRGLANTLIYCALSIALALLVNPLAAYALSRYNLPSQYKILLFLIATMAFPGVVTMIPNFLLLRDLGLLNTFAALLLPGMANGYAIFLLKGFFDSLPKELFEAADIDGATEWQKFWIITMNLSKPILAVIALGAFNGAYANFMYAFILCQDRSMWTLMVWLYQLQQFSSQGVVFASLIIAAIPTLLVFVLCQNVIIRGIVVPTEK
jgi:ABC-type glycerol-3-phosphate transport system permease component